MSRLAHNAFGLPRGVLGRIAGWIMSRGNADMERAIVDALPLSPDTHVLEVGFGPGVGLRLLAERCPAGRVAGADPSPVMVRQARRRVPSGVELVEAGVSDLPWPDGTFDAVVSCNNIMLWP
ncbi:class I SAM-dependent methyltransferase, partial [Carbonactinospora thermoautotrophica]